MLDHYERDDQKLHLYQCARCRNTFESIRHLASTCPICGYSGSENLTSETDIETNK